MSATIPATEVAPPRDFVYIKPRRRRLSDYEAVTCYTQPDPEAFDKEGWFLRTSEGRPAWLRESTRLEHPHWFDFRDPASHWYRTYVRMQADQERSIERVTEDAVLSGTFAHMDRTWLHEVLGVHYRVWSYVEYGLFRAFGTAQREALSDTLGNALCFEAFDRTRHAQDIVLYLMDIETAVEDYRDHGAKDRWTTDEMYQPTRALVERLIAFDDWAELAVVTNLVLDPIVAEVAVSQLVRRFGPFHGDFVTPTIVTTTERDRRRNRQWTEELVRMVTAEDVPAAEANRRTIQGWLDRWTPEVQAAARALAPCYDVPPIQVAEFAPTLAAALDGQARIVADLGFAPTEAEA